MHHRTMGRLLLSLAVTLLSVLSTAHAQEKGNRGPSPKVKKLWGTYQKGHLETVIKRGERLIERNGGGNAVDLHHIVGRALVATGQHDRAISHLKRTLSSEVPAHTRAWSLNFLGKAHYQLGHFAAADSAFRASRNMQATENSTESSERWMRDLGFDEMYSEWTRADTDRFTLFVSSRVEASTDRLVERYGSAWNDLASFFGGTPDQQVRLFVWASRQEAKQHGLNVGFANPEYAVIHKEVSQTSGHELAHVFEDRVLSPSHQAGLISEGIAVYLDQTGRDRLETARQALGETGKQVSMRDWWRKDPDAWAQIPGRIRYPVAGAFVAYLAERGGKKNLLQLLHDQRLERARTIYGADTLSSWIASFEAKLKK